MTTRERIIEQAFLLFSKLGYDAVSVRDIAAEVELRESALYRHFKSKQDIFDTIMEENANLLRSMQSRLITPAGASRDVSELCSFDRLYQSASNLFLFYLKDQLAGRLRQMLTVEQYRSPRAAELLKKLYFSSTVELYADMFKRFIDIGYFILCDAHIAAVQFYAPVFMLIVQYDSMPDHAAEGMTVLKSHIREFCRHYIRINT